MDLAEQLATKELVVFLGTGGVGKTTVAAAAALAASRDRKTLVLTIDPARRLADALGVKLGSNVVEVAPNLHALMLDTKASLDAQIARYAPNPETFKRITSSRFYAQLSDAFAGSEEFVAMGALHDILQDGGYDLVVVDTPPSRHAVDFLATNAKLIRVFESGVVKYLFKPTKFLRLGGGYMANVLARWTSTEYLQEVGEFMTTFDQMFIDMEQRVRKMQAILTDPSRTALNLVTTADREGIPQTTALFEEVTGRLKLTVDACIVNRYYPLLPVEARHLEPGHAARLAGALEVPEDDARAFLTEARAATRFYEALALQHAENAATLQERVKAPFHFVPALGETGGEMGRLRSIAGRLVPSR